MTTAQEQLEVRFSLRTALIVLSCLGVGCALLFSTPHYLAVPALIFVTVALPAALTAGVVYTGGAWRAYCIGGLFPSGLQLYTTGWLLGVSLLEGPGRIESFNEWIDFCDEIGPQYRAYAGASWAMTIAVSTIVVVIRHLARRRRDSE